MLLLRILTLLIGFSAPLMMAAQSVTESPSSITPKYSNEFLAIGVGARALGMSNAHVASVNDVTAGYWNPAGLLGIKSDLQVAAMHAEYFAGIAKYDYASIGKKLDSLSAASFSVIRFGVDDIPNTTELIDADGNINYDRITSFSAADYAFIFSYARKLKVPGLNLGGSAKIIYRKVGDFANSWGFGLDAGLTYERDKWKFAASLRDVTSTFNAWTFTLDDRTREVFVLTGNEIPENSLEITLPRLIGAVAREFQFGEKFKLLAEIDIDITTDGKRNVLIRSNPLSFDPHMGFELGYQNIVFLRTGIGNIQRINSEIDKEEFTFQPNFGIGLKIREVYLDYALTDIGDQSAALYSNIFSLKFNLFKGS
jgi:hypothetical protein